MFGNRRRFWRSEPPYVGCYDLKNNSPWTAFVLSFVRNCYLIWNSGGMRWSGWKPNLFEKRWIKSADENPQRTNRKSARVERQSMKERLDVVGYWTEIKLQILQEYANAYAQVLKNQRFIKHVAYIDGFAGAGEHISKQSGELIAGSPARALAIEPKFSHYHFVEMDEARAKRLTKMGEQQNATVYQGDCNEVLLKEIFPQCRYEDFRRALCLLDPYGLNPNWEVVETAGKMKSIEIFLNFMIMDANMNILLKNPEKVAKSQIERMRVFWGDDSWRKAGYTAQPG